MHELGIANEILDVAVAEADRHSAGKVTAIRLRVGVLRAIEPGNLSFLFEHIARGTVAAGAELSIEEELLRVDCAACGVSEARSLLWECPRCGGRRIVLAGGDTLDVLSLEIEK